MKSKECLEKYSLLASLTILESWLNASAQLGLSVVNQCGISHLLGLGGPPDGGLWSSTTYRHALHRIWVKGVMPFGLGRLFGHQCGWNGSSWLFSHAGEIFSGEASGGDGGACLSMRWYKVVRALLSSGETAVQDDLTSSEEVIMTLALLFYGLFF